MKLFCGYDEREDIGFRVFEHSVRKTTLHDVEIIKLDSKGLPVGSNDFTCSRFLVPWLCGFKGMAVFADASDMLCRSDITELEHLFDPECAVQVVKHDYRTRHPIKYRMTDMQCPNRDYPRKNWASLMVINCAHPAWHSMTPEVISEVGQRPAYLLGMEWLPSDNIGSIPDHWNRLVDEGQDVVGASILHWTAGIPAFDFYADAPGSEYWHAELAQLEQP